MESRDTRFIFHLHPVSALALSQQAAAAAAAACLIFKYCIIIHSLKSHFNLRGSSVHTAYIHNARAHTHTCHQQQPSS